MKYQHNLLYWVEGLSKLEARTDKEITLHKEIIFDESVNWRVLLVENPDSNLIEHDRNKAIPLLLLDPGIFDENLANAIEEIRESRKRKFSAGLYVLFIREGDMDDFIISQKMEHEEFIICLGGSPKETIRMGSEPYIRAVLSSLLLATASARKVTKLSESVIFFTSNGKPIHSFKLSAGSGSFFILERIDEELINSFKKGYSIIIKEKELERVNRLLLSSLQTEDDKLRSFMFAWMALEIFVNKRLAYMKAITSKK